MKIIVVLIIISDGKSCKEVKSIRNPLKNRIYPEGRVRKFSKNIEESARSLEELVVA